MSASSRSLRQPAYRLHKPSGQAVVSIPGRGDVYLGKHGSAKSKHAYKRLMLEWLANDGYLPPPKTDELTVTELSAAYKQFCKRYYVTDGKPNAGYDKVKMVMRFLGNGPYGRTPARDFGPLALKALQHQLIAAGGCRRYVNDQVDVIRRCFKWAVSEELIPPSVHHALQTVPGLRRGRTTARETPPVLPVSAEVVEATLAHLPPAVDDMIRLLRLIGCRPHELCDLRPRNVDRSGDVWAYMPERHKAQHHGRGRTILIGPKAQAILAPYLLRDADAYCFSPAEADARRRAALHAARKTPLSCGNRPGTNRRRKPRHQPGDKYCSTALNRAVRRACDKADKAAHDARPEVAADVRLVPRWFVYQLRHSVGTDLRKRYGLETAQVVLGHAKADVTQIYAERDLAKAAEVMREVG